MSKIQFAFVVITEMLIATTSRAEGVKSQRPMLGVSLFPIEKSESTECGVARRQSGVIVIGVTKGSPANVSGIETCDVIVRMNGSNIEDLEDVVSLVKASQVGDSFRLVVVRNGEEFVIDGVYRAWTPRCGRRN